MKRPHLSRVKLIAIIAQAYHPEFAAFFDEDGEPFPYEDGYSGDSIALFLAGSLDEDVFDEQGNIEVEGLEQYQRRIETALDELTSVRDAIAQQLTKMKGK